MSGPPAPATTSSRALKARYLLVSLAVLALDQWTKWLVETHVPLHTSREILPAIHLSHVRNSGVAFGMFAAQGELATTLVLAALGLAALGLVLWYFARTPATHRALMWALALVLGGAVGNLLDRLSSGAVTDFVGVYLGDYRWPDFNVADSAIFVGILLIFIDAFRTPAVPDAADSAG